MGYLVFRLTLWPARSGGFALRATPHRRDASFALQPLARTLQVELAHEIVDVLGIDPWQQAPAPGQLQPLQIHRSERP